MQSTNALLAALLVISTTTAAEPPADTPAMAPIPAEHAHVAQAATQATKELAEGSRSDRSRSDRSRSDRSRDDDDSQREPTDEETLALTALEGLMAQPAQRSLPILKKVLSGAQSTLVKRRALFVLSQIQDPEAQTLLLDITKTGEPALRAEAIRSIGIGGNSTSLAALQDIYSNGDSTIRSQVLEAWLISGNKNEVYQAALNAKSDVDANNAIRTLSVMGAVDELRKLGELKKPGRDLVQAYAIAGDVTSLRKIAGGSGDIEARRDAVRQIGIVQSDEARTVLKDIYASSDAPEIRKAALEGMLINGDDDGVLALYRNSKNAEEKRVLLRTLSMMNGDAALQAIDAALEGKQ